MKRLKRSSSISVLLVLALTAILSACGSNNNNTASEAPSGSPSASPSASSSASASASAAQTRTPIPNPRVAFVYIGPPGDGGWTYQHDQGVKFMEKELGIKADTVENVPESADAERVITDLAQNHDIIFTTSFGYMDYTLNVAQKFPDVIFEHAGGYKTNDNMSTYFGMNWEASYLSGIAAGKMTKKNVLGYVAAFPIPELVYNINAFTLGAQSVNPDVKVNVVWTNTWFDPTTERNAAMSLLDKGADVLMAYQDSPASLQAAAERGALAGGNDSDMTRYAPEAYLTNPVWNWGQYYVDTVKSVMDGTWTSQQYLGSFEDGMVDIAPIGESVPDDVKQLIEDAKQKFVEGSFNLFSGPIYDQSGAEKVASGQSMSNEEILNMNWFVQGVEGSIPQ
ncbi:BMP family ABC transporter substrate-binding protein [Cohnella lubricantis]|uniref:BMP family ABC transporter substrate-binding protein n=1 Tax=Cohnella lubricantis TaxID=2163172 RepID=A0A841TA97_9BACL|nr:BMP family ABC transporter substrate-binding protein [Cohnella lubricantis]MBB6676986.1 BMP family ABC transporter substrate-binding protein [Cohnella lubricantis]MBP2117044.1 basic membrane protein A [Cohnella lubricantis]